MMDLVEKSELCIPAQDERDRRAMILAQYLPLRLVPRRHAAAVIRVPLADRQRPAAAGHRPGVPAASSPAARLRLLRRPRARSPARTCAYWGPADRGRRARSRALSVNMGPDSNVDVDQLQLRRAGADDRRRTSSGPQTNRRSRCVTVAQHASRRWPLRPPAWPPRPAPRSSADARRRRRPTAAPGDRAQASHGARSTRRSTTSSTAPGELDALRYGALLEPRGLVGVRGAGFSLRRPLLRQERHAHHPRRRVHAEASR